MHRLFLAIVWPALAGLVVLAGCMDNTAKVDTAGSPRRKPEPTRETWDVCVMQGARVGYVHTTVHHKTKAGETVVRTENVTRLSLNRNGQVATMETTVASDETLQGQLLGFEMEMRVGPAPTRMTGQVHGERLDIEILGPGATKAKKESIPWSADFLGPTGVEQSLARKPMRPGERRTVKMLMPVLDNVAMADVKLVAQQFETTGLRSGPHELLRINSTTPMGGQTIDTALWCDRTGDVLKSATGLIEAYRATKAEALEEPEVAKLDLLADMLVKPDRPLPNAHQTKRVRYRVHLDGGDPAAAFVTGPTQEVKSIDPHTAEITVYAIRPGRPDGNRNAPKDPPTEDDRRPNNFIQSDDPSIVADAEKAAGKETDPWRVAVALERFVHEEVKNRGFSQAFASAAEVAKMREGDCTEHSVFLAALARARGIPARVAMGLVYVPQYEAFGYHMWTEVYIDGRWIPIDGVVAAGGIGAGHLKIAQSTLEGANGFSAFLPVLPLIGRLKIDVVNAE
ncbi:MAG: transglutaminase domain-containing protein [Thermoguttaceae bacterium]